MPTALARLTDDGGPYLTNADKPIEVAGGSVIALSSADTSFWTQQRWEIYAYPVGWTAPAGWSTDGNGVIYSTSVTPSSFTLPANTSIWGKWGVRLTVNNGLTDGVADANMVDETLAFSVLSPSGLRDLMQYEGAQFGDDWTGDMQKNLRTQEVVSIGTFGTQKVVFGTVTTADATATVVASIPVITAGVQSFLVSASPQDLVLRAASTMSVSALRWAGVMPGAP